MKNLGYYNGKFDLIENMTVPMNDRVSYFGDGVYDVTYARNYIPYCLDAHLDRFFNSARLLRITVPMSKSDLGKLLCEMIRKLDSPDQMVYWQVTRGTAMRNHLFPDTPANLWIILRDIPVNDTFKPITLMTVEDTRFLHCNIKTLNLIPNVMAEQAAHDAGFNSAVFCRDGFVTECAHANIHIIKNGKFITHPTDNLILPGIARANILKYTEILDIPTEIRPFTVDEMLDADEVMMSSSGSFCLPVSKINDTAVKRSAPALLTKLQNALVSDFLTSTAL